MGPDLLPGNPRAPLSSGLVVLLPAPTVLPDGVTAGPDLLPGKPLLRPHRFPEDGLDACRLPRDRLYSGRLLRDRRAAQRRELNGIAMRMAIPFFR